MNADDEAELRRLCLQLERIDERTALSVAERAAFKKAGLALHEVFRRGQRAELERRFDSLGKPMDEAQRAGLCALGIDPDSFSEKI